MVNLWIYVEVESKTFVDWLDEGCKEERSHGCLQGLSFGKMVMTFTEMGKTAESEGWRLGVRFCTW